VAGFSDGYLLDHCVVRVFDEEKDLTLRLFPIVRNTPRQATLSFEGGGIKGGG